MAKFRKTKVQKIGNSKGLTLPAPEMEDHGVNDLGKELISEKTIFGWAVIPEKHYPDYLKLKKEFYAIYEKKAVITANKKA